MSIDLFAFPSPNNFKVLLTLEALGVDYNLHKVDIMKGEQTQEPFININPCGLTPAIKDGDLNLGESANIIEYLVSKFDKGHKFSYAQDSPFYWKLNEFLFYHATGVSVAQDKVFVFGTFNPNETFTIEAFKKAVEGYYTKLESKLKENGTGYYVGDKLTIADLIALPHAKTVEHSDVDLEKFPNVKAWREKISKEPFVEKAYAKFA